MLSAQQGRSGRVPGSLRVPPTTGSVDAGSGPDEGRAGRSGEAVLLVAAVIVPAAYVFWRIRGAYRFYMDDFLQFATAQRSGLSWELLGLNVFQHFGPVNRMGHLLLLRVGDFSLAAGMITSAVLVAALQGSLWWLLRELRVSVGRTLLSMVAVGFSVTVLDTAVWTDAALHIFPALVITTAVVAAHVRVLRTGSTGWRIATVVLFALGPLTQERALFALPLLLLTQWLLVDAGRPWIQRWRRLRAGWAPVAAMTVIAMGWAAFIYLGYAGGVITHPTLGTTLRTGLAALTEGVFPPWLGLPVQSLTPTWAQFTILLLLLAIAVGLIRLHPRNADPLAFFGAAFLLYYGFLGVSPLLTPENLAATALRLHNATYLLVPTVTAAACLTWRRPADADRDHHTAPWPAAVGALALAVVLVLTGGSFTSDRWKDERAAHAWLANVAAAQPQWSSRDVTVIPLLAPTTVVTYWASLYGRGEYFLRFHDRDFVPAPLGDDPVVLDADGVVRPVALRTEEDLRLDESAGCGALQRTIMSAAQPVGGEPLLLRLTYRASEPEPVRATSLSGTTEDAAYAGNWQVPLPSGEHTVVIPLYSSDVPGVLLDWLTPAAETCVLEASVVRPVFQDDDGCTGMDAYGNPTQAVLCPAVRRP